MCRCALACLTPKLFVCFAVFLLLCFLPTCFSASFPKKAKKKSSFFQSVKKFFQTNKDKKQEDFPEFRIDVPAMADPSVGLLSPEVEVDEDVIKAGANFEFPCSSADNVQPNQESSGEISPVYQAVDLAADIPEATVLIQAAKASQKSDSKEPDQEATQVPDSQGKEEGSEVKAVDQPEVKAVDQPEVKTVDQPEVKTVGNEGQTSSILKTGQTEMEPADGDSVEKRDSHLQFNKEVRKVDILTDGDTDVNVSESLVKINDEDQSGAAVKITDEEQSGAAVNPQTPAKNENREAPMEWVVRDVPLTSVVSDVLKIAATAAAKTQFEEIKNALREARLNLKLSKKQSNSESLVEWRKDVYEVWVYINSELDRGIRHNAFQRVKSIATYIVHEACNRLDMDMSSGPTGEKKLPSGRVLYKHDGTFPDYFMHGLLNVQSLHNNASQEIKDVIAEAIETLNKRKSEMKTKPQRLTRMLFYYTRDMMNQALMAARKGDKKWLQQLLSTMMEQTTGTLMIDPITGRAFSVDGSWPPAKYDREGIFSDFIIDLLKTVPANKALPKKFHKYANDGIAKIMKKKSSRPEAPMMLPREVENKWLGVLEELKGAVDKRDQMQTKDIITKMVKRACDGVQLGSIPRDSVQDGTYLGLVMDLLLMVQLHPTSWKTSEEIKNILDEATKRVKMRKSQLKSGSFVETRGESGEKIQAYLDQLIKAMDARDAKNLKSLVSDMTMRYVFDLKRKVYSGVEVDDEGSYGSQRGGPTSPPVKQTNLPPAKQTNREESSDEGDEPDEESRPVDDDEERPQSQPEAKQPPKPANPDEVMPFEESDEDYGPPVVRSVQIYKAGDEKLGGLVGNESHSQVREFMERRAASLGIRKASEAHEEESKDMRRSARLMTARDLESSSSSEDEADWPQERQSQLKKSLSSRARKTEEQPAKVCKQANQTSQKTDTATELRIKGSEDTSLSRVSSTSSSNVSGGTASSITISESSDDSPLPCRQHKYGDQAVTNKLLARVRTAEEHQTEVWSTPTTTEETEKADTAGELHKRIKEWEDAYAIKISSTESSNSGKSGIVITPSSDGVRSKTNAPEQQETLNQVRSEETNPAETSANRATTRILEKLYTADDLFHMMKECEDKNNQLTASAPGVHSDASDSGSSGIVITPTLGVAETAELPSGSGNSQFSDDAPRLASAAVSGGEAASGTASPEMAIARRISPTLVPFTSPLMSKIMMSASQQTLTENSLYSLASGSLADLDTGLSDGTVSVDKAASKLNNHRDALNRLKVFLSDESIDAALVNWILDHNSLEDLLEAYEKWKDNAASMLDKNEAGNETNMRLTGHHINVLHVGSLPSLETKTVTGLSNRTTKSADSVSSAVALSELFCRLLFLEALDTECGELNGCSSPIGRETGLGTPSERRSRASASGSGTSRAARSPKESISSSTILTVMIKSLERLNSNLNAGWKITGGETASQPEATIDRDGRLSPRTGLLQLTNFSDARSNRSASYVGSMCEGEEDNLESPAQKLLQVITSSEAVNEPDDAMAQKDVKLLGLVAALNGICRTLIGLLIMRATEEKNKSDVVDGDCTEDTLHQFQQTVFRDLSQVLQAADHQAKVPSSNNEKGQKVLFFLCLHANRLKCFGVNEIVVSECFSWPTVMFVLIGKQTKGRQESTSKIHKI